MIILLLRELRVFSMCDVIRFGCPIAGEMNMKTSVGGGGPNKWPLPSYQPGVIDGRRPPAPAAPVVLCSAPGAADQAR